VTWDPSITIPVVVATIGLLGGQILALLSRRHDRQQSARTTLLEPARKFATATLEALASLREVTPPEALPPGGPGHRNYRLLSDIPERHARLLAAAKAIDAVRAARADVRLTFHPKSWAAEHSRQALACLRLSLESAERFYAAHDEQADPAAWFADSSPALRAAYKQHRRQAYDALDLFFDDVAQRLHRPTWDPRKIAAAHRTQDPRYSAHQQKPEHA
jgi:hypothetical protein